MSAEAAYRAALERIASMFDGQTDDRALMALIERYAKHCEQEAFTLEALATERRRLAADMRFEFTRLSTIPPKGRRP